MFPLALVPTPVCGAWVISWVLMTHPPAASRGLCRSCRKPATLEAGPGEGSCPGLLEFHSYSFAPGVQVRLGVACSNVASERPNQDHLVREQRQTRWQGRPHRDGGARASLWAGGWSPGLTCIEVPTARVWLMSTNNKVEVLSESNLSISTDSYYRGIGCLPKVAEPRGGKKAVPSALACTGENASPGTGVGGAGPGSVAVTPAGGDSAAVLRCVHGGRGCPGVGSGWFLWRKKTWQGSDGRLSRGTELGNNDGGLPGVVGARTVRHGQNCRQGAWLVQGPVPPGSAQCPRDRCRGRKAPRALCLEAGPSPAPVSLCKAGGVLFLLLMLLSPGTEFAKSGTSQACKSRFHLLCRFIICIKIPPGSTGWKHRRHPGVGGVWQCQLLPVGCLFPPDSWGFIF